VNDPLMDAPLMKPSGLQANDRTAQT
jgi:hypothetical protein